MSTCIADLDTPCDCPDCEAYMIESMEDALRSWVPGEQTARDRAGSDKEMLYRILKGETR